MRWIPIPPDWTELIATSFDDPDAPAIAETHALGTVVEISGGRLWMIGSASFGGYVHISDWPDASDAFIDTWWLPWRQIRASVPSIEVLRRTGRVDVGETNRIVFGGGGRFALEGTRQPHAEWRAELDLLRTTPWIELLSFEVNELASLNAQIAAAEAVEPGELWLVGDNHGIRLLLGKPDDRYPVFQVRAQCAPSWRGRLQLPRGLLRAPAAAAGRSWRLYTCGARLIATVVLGDGLLWLAPILHPVEIQPDLLEVRRRMVDLAHPAEAHDVPVPPRTSPAAALFADLLAALPARSDGGQVLISLRAELTVQIACVVEGGHKRLVAQSQREHGEAGEPVRYSLRMAAAAPIEAACELGGWIGSLLGRPLSPDDVAELGWIWPEDPTRPSDLMRLGPPPRVTRESTRFLRDRAPVEAIKELYQGRCQVCGYRIERPDGSWYADAHHLWPLEHGGPDVIDNLVVVCPTHHKELDLGALRLDARTGNLRAQGGVAHPHHGQALRVVDGHMIDPAYLVWASEVWSAGVGGVAV